MPRVIVTVPREMHHALQQESERTKAPVAALIREAIAEWAQRRGLAVEDTVRWGGKSEADGSQGQQAAVAAV